MARLLALAGTLLALTAFPAIAQDSPEFEACIAKTGGVTSDMLDCGKAEIGKWDKRLNVAYQTLMHHEQGVERAKLQNEQRVWLKHHLSETRRLADAPDNGSLAFIDSQNFELQDLSERTLALEKLVSAMR